MVDLGRARRERRSLRDVAMRAAMPVLMVATAAALVLAIDPAAFAAAVSRFDLLALPAGVAITAAMYVAQGVRWHHLLRAAGAHLRLRDSVLLNAAGQAITAIVPLGDLTRAVFAAEASHVRFGRVAATVTVQELAYTLLLVLASVPVLLSLHLGVGVVAIVVGGAAGVVVILSVRPVYAVVHGVVEHVPLLRRLLGQIDALHEATAELLHRPDTVAWTVLDAARAALAITLLWLIVEALHPGSLGWWDAAFVLGLSYVGGAASMIPGGAGANEASMVGLLILAHVDPPTAAAAAIVQRMFTTGLATAFGWSAYAVARRHFPLGSPFAVRVEERQAEDHRPLDRAA